jgi:hypothetical protein
MGDEASTGSVKVASFTDGDRNAVAPKVSPCGVTASASETVAALVAVAVLPPIGDGPPVGVLALIGIG